MLPVYYSDLFLEHKTGSFHPERPARLEAIVKALKGSPFPLDWRDPSPATLLQVQRVHDGDYVDGLRHACEMGGGSLDGDTVVSRHSYEAAMLAAGAWIQGSQTVHEAGSPGVVLCRPPGHHAEPDRAMGFCLLSNAAIAALDLVEQQGIPRVAILDWDVHHGNGTEKVVQKDPRLAYVSLHQWPLYPGTGSSHQKFPLNNVLNVPLASGSGWPVYETAMQEKVVPFLRQFDPQVLLVSAGFDCADGDPLAGMCLTAEDFGRLTRMCLGITRRCLFGLEGGYDLENLAEGWLQVVAECLQS